MTSPAVAAGRAVAAWRSLRPRPGLPDSIELVAHSTIYRLNGVGRDGAAVIAKLSPTSTAAIERRVYEGVLARAPVSSPIFYGLAAEGDEHDWLFLEDVGTERFSPLSPTHRALVAQWLGRLHATAAPLAATTHLPDRGPGHYLRHLRSGRRMILDHLHDPTLSAGDRHVLIAARAQCDLLELHWQEIEELCAGVPLTLVHGDLRSKNVRVRTSGRGTDVLPIDWESAGWGVPAADLAPSRGRSLEAQVDLDVYATLAREYWPSVDVSTLRRLVAVGGVFRRLAAIDWASQGLAYPRPLRPLAQLGVYQDELAQLMRSLGLAGEAAPALLPPAAPG
jgi:aminoglycoside phosphotransferase (APT) family kinase protein